MLVRHGESEGNADRAHYETTPDYALNLTVQGHAQAVQAGTQIKNLIGTESLFCYLSPYYRTRQTWAGIASQIEGHIFRAFEDPRLRELDWGHLRHPDDNQVIINARKKFSTFYYRIPDGESGADVYDRVSSFLESLFRDFRADNYPANTLIVTHGLTLRLFLMRWFHWSVEEFESLESPDNCQIVVMEQTTEGHYRLTAGLAKRKILR